MNKEAFLKYNNYREKLREHLKRIIGGAGDPLAEPMTYAALGSGKNLRPVLFLAVLEGYGRIPDENDYSFACALELIHAYSLVHDDLPEMDNDDYRRGQETVHKKFGHSVALLTGDALLNHAYETLISLSAINGAYAEAALHVSRCAGEKGMICGQAMEFTVPDNQMNLDTLGTIRILKTAKLIEAAVSGAAIVSGNRQDVCTMSLFARQFGTAFQLADDLKDEIIDKKNILSYIDRDKAEALLKKSLDDSFNSLSKTGVETDFIKDFCMFVLDKM